MGSTECKTWREIFSVWTCVGNFLETSRAGVKVGQTNDNSPSGTRDLLENRLSLGRTKTCRPLSPSVWYQNEIKFLTACDQTSSSNQLLTQANQSSCRIFVNAHWETERSSKFALLSDFLHSLLYVLTLTKDRKWHLQTSCRNKLWSSWQEVPFYLCWKWKHLPREFCFEMQNLPWVLKLSSGCVGDPTLFPRCRIQRLVVFN